MSRSGREKVVSEFGLDAIVAAGDGDDGGTHENDDGVGGDEGDDDEEEHDTDEGALGDHVTGPVAARVQIWRRHNRFLSNIRTVKKNSGLCLKKAVGEKNTQQFKAYISQALGLIFLRKIRYDFIPHK